MPHVCQDLRGIWTVPLITSFHFCQLCIAQTVRSDDHFRSLPTGTILHSPLTPTGEYDKVQTHRALAEGCKQTCSSSVSASLRRSFISSATSSTWMVQSMAWFFFLDIASCVCGKKKSVHLKINSSSEGRDWNLQEWSGNSKIQTTWENWNFINVCTWRWVVVRFRSFRRLWAATPVEMLSKVDLLSSIVRTANRMSSVKSQIHLSQPDKKIRQHNFSLVFVSVKSKYLKFM